MGKSCGGCNQFCCDRGGEVNIGEEGETFRLMTKDPSR